MSVSGTVVSNSGPLMALAKLNLLHLLRELYGHVSYSRSIEVSGTRWLWL